MNKTVISLGDINGISPEITIKALNCMNIPPEKVIIAGSSVVFDYYEKNFGLKLNKNYEILEIPLRKTDIKIGQDTKEAGEFAFKSLMSAIDIIKNGQADSIVTAPVSKHAMNLAGHYFSGQTEILEKYLAHDKQKAEMLFVAPKLRVLLLTRHVSLSNAVKSLTKKLILEKAETINSSLFKYFGIKNPQMAICALNPHASEDGLFGSEEKEIIFPAVRELKRKGINIIGVYPADTLFQNAISGTLKTDCVIALYHDQGLIPLKLLGFDELVNATVGLDILRTSPAHGTAFDIAGKNAANPNSMISAIKLALGS